MVVLSKQFRFNKHNVERAARVLAWSVTAAFAAFLITVVANVDFDERWMFLVPAINTTLYALLDFAKAQVKETNVVTE